MSFVELMDVFIVARWIYFGEWLDIRLSWHHDLTSNEKGDIHHCNPSALVNSFWYSDYSM